MPATAAGHRATPAILDVKKWRQCSHSFCRPFRAASRGKGARRRLCSLIKVDSTASTEWHETKLKHVVESQQFSQAALATVFETAKEMESVKRGTPAAKQLDGYIMSTLFYEPSTRTRLSFESAMGRLGGTVIATENAGEYSSAAKGETLEGTATEAT